MNLTARLTLILTLLFSFAIGLSAQETSTTATDTAATAATAAAPEEESLAAAAEGRSSYEIRNRFSNLLRQHPQEVATILTLDPTLLSNEPFLAGYPEIARFVAAHPEVRRNPRFYLAEFGVPGESRGMAGEVLEGLFIFSILLFFAFVLAWLVRTIVEQKRWNRLSRTQSEVHNKILDRFSSSEELLTYIKTPAGTKFLESAPIPLHADAAPKNVPLARVIWSVQLGVVVAAGAIGMLLISGRFEKDAAQELFAMGVIGFCIGAGFIASAFVSIVLSRRLGLWKDPSAAVALDDSELVR